MAGFTVPNERGKSTDDALCVARRELKCLAAGLERTFGTSLPVPVFSSLVSVKEFCSGLLTRPTDHPWSGAVRNLTIRDRLSISGSLFLFRKVLPASSPSVGEFLKKLSSPAPEPPAGFYRFISSEIERMFPLGWDRRWGGAVRGSVPSVSSCLESSRKMGGARGIVSRGQWVDRSEFCSNLLNRYSRWRPNVDRVRVMKVLLDGKERIVTVNSVDATVLSPFHSLLYDAVSEQSWCLRGDAKASRFSEFTLRDGEVFVSGDYESATDNLNQDVARHILASLSRNCTKVPLFVREAALSTLGGYAEWKGESVPVVRGQLMGNFMSFPLLCLQNYLAFRFLVRREVPVKINGDDIVFRATLDEFKVWSEGVRSCGLSLSLGKTAIQSRWFSLNSSFFVAGTKRVRLAPVIRSTVLFKELETSIALVGRVETFRGFGAARRDRLVSWLLRRFSKAVWGSQRSLRRGLGVRVSDNSLRLAGLFERESYYLSLDKRWDPPLPVAQSGYFLSSVPEGWARVVSDTRVDFDVQREFARTLVEHSWRFGAESLGPAPRFDERKGTLHFVHRPLTARHAKLAGLTLAALRRFLGALTLPKKRVLGVARWVRVCVESVDFPRAVTFVPAR